MERRRASAGIMRYISQISHFSSFLALNNWCSERFDNTLSVWIVTSYDLFWCILLSSLWILVYITKGEAAMECFESMHNYCYILHSKPQLIFLLILDPDNSLTCDCRAGARRRDSAPLTPTQEVFITLILSVTRDLETVTLNHTQFCVSLSSRQFVSN